jgi:cation-transporting ATPase 13A1
MDVQHPPSLKRVTIHKAAPNRKLVLTAVFVVLYAYVGNFVYQTAGEPRAEALRQQAELEATGAVAPKLSAVSQRRKSAALEEELMRQAGFGDTAEADEFAELSAEEKASQLQEKAEKKAREAVARLEEAKKKKEHDGGGAAAAGEKTGGDPLDPDSDEKPLPPAYLPNAWALAALMGTLTAHALFWLLCRWLVWFKAAALFDGASVNTALDGREPCFVHVEPLKHRGSAAIVALVPSKVNPGRYGFVFQRQAYELLDAAAVAKLRTARRAEAEAAAAHAVATEADVTETSASDIADEKEAKDPRAFVGGGAEHGGVQLVQCPTDLPLRHYSLPQSAGGGGGGGGYRGLSAAAAEERAAKFGPNTLSIASPKFLDLYKEQLMSPIAMFQFFTAFLWMMDE